MEEYGFFLQIRLKSSHYSKNGIYYIHTIYVLV